MSCWPWSSNASTTETNAIWDLKKIIHEAAYEAAWESALLPTPCFGWERPCRKMGRELMFSWNALEINSKAELEITDRKEQPLTLFETTFTNSNLKTEIFNFEAERSTESSMEMSVKSGVTIGRAMKFAISLKAPCTPMRVAGILGGEVKWAESATEKYTKSQCLSWGVKTPVTLKNGHGARVTLSVIQEEIMGVLTIETTVTIVGKEGKLPVYVVTEKNKKKIASTLLGINGIYENATKHPDLKDNPDLIKIDYKSLRLKSRANVRSVFCVKQNVNVEAIHCDKCDKNICTAVETMSTQKVGVCNGLSNDVLQESSV